MSEEIQHLSVTEEHPDHASESLAGSESTSESNPESTFEHSAEESSLTSSGEIANSALLHEAEPPPLAIDTESLVAEALFAPDKPLAILPQELESETEPVPAPIPIAAETAAAETAAEEPAITAVSEPAAAGVEAEIEALAFPSVPAAAEPIAEASAPVPAPVPARANLVIDALSDVGCVRTNNEDAFGYDSELGIYVICDGMGGMAAGEVASATAVAALVNTFAESAGTELPVGTRLQQSVHMANHVVWDLGQLPEHKGMGTTTVSAAVDGHKLIVANVGDSRAYMMQGGRTTQVTVDHSYLNELIRNGTLTPETAQTADLHGYESVITRAIGVADTVDPDYYAIDLIPGTYILLCTDGLTRYMAQEELAAILQATPFESVCTNLIDLAKRRGGHDNITCLLMLVLPAEGTQGIAAQTAQ